MAGEAIPQLTCWLLDTRPLWQGNKIEFAAGKVLNLLNNEERKTVTSKYRIEDAKMSLGSALLKRLFVAKSLGLPWSEIRFGRKGHSVHGKPCHILPDGSVSPLEFNVSHQAGLVALVGYRSSDVALGVDIVCVNERNDYRTIDRDGFEGWVEIYRDIFSAQEIENMTYRMDSFELPDGTEVTPTQLGLDELCCSRNRTVSIKLGPKESRSISSNTLIDIKLRRFYTFWCYKEAYIKLTGEALLAPWIKELEFRNVRAPKVSANSENPADAIWGERVTDVEVFLHDEKVPDVKMDIQSFGENYMIALAAKPFSKLSMDHLPNFEKVDLERDVIEFANTKGGQSI